MYMKPFKMMFKKRKRKNFFFLCLIFLFFILKVKKNYTAQNRANIIKKRDLLPIWSIKIHGTIAFTAIVPLLNLNLNYEKLQCKDSDN